MEPPGSYHGGGAGLATGRVEGVLKGSERPEAGCLGEFRAIVSLEFQLRLFCHPFPSAAAGETGVSMVV